MNLSHAEQGTLIEALDKARSKVFQRGDLPYISVERQLELVEELSQFGLGRFVLERGGLNGYWTHYVVTHPQQGLLTRLDAENKPFTALESFILDQAPTSLATQERFQIFKREIQKRLSNSMSLASVPCGLMADLLDLDFSQISGFSLCGIDIDPESIAQGQALARDRGLESRSSFLQRDAWDLCCDGKFDLITSNGLSIYEPDNQKIVDLYRQFFFALKPGGWLITSFLIPPPKWNADRINPEHALLQRAIFSDILEAKWQIFRSEELVKSQLLDAGFDEIEIIYDQAHIFPTVIARRI
ncbi:hypothetical protein RHOW815_001272 [Candidatus Rhabdochlamydia sp. W815]|nr:MULTISPECIES: methyltransferase domain-containing protein [Rhabdochlamydia]KAG6558738.1 hypothetical protein RHOW815_001272 [Candidatus Rhabdochlamydia sp. W815]MCL6755819.1 methyltransferase domain-containing protein [Candidatus Rhabdochlamydia oedothoracis]